MVRAPTNLSLVEDIPRVVITFDNKSGIIDWGNQWDVFLWDDDESIKEYYTLIYRNQENYLGDSDKSVVSNYNVVGASRTDVFEFSDFTTDYQTAYTFIATSIEAEVFLLTSEVYSGIPEDTFDWNETWDSRTWSSPEFGNLLIEEISTLDNSIDNWDSDNWNFSWETYEFVEDENILSKDGYKLSWSVEDRGENIHLIYRSETSGKKEDDYELIGATEDNYFYDNGVNTDNNYYYRVAYVSIVEESTPSNFSSITTGIPKITDDPTLVSTVINDVISTDSSSTFDEASIQQVSSSASTFIDESIAYDLALRTQSVASIQQTPSTATTIEEGTLTSSEISLLQEEFTSSVGGATLEPIEGTSITQDAESVAFEIERVTDASITPSVTTESSNVLESPSPVSVNAAGVQSTDAVEITNAVTEVTSATAIGSAIASGDEQTSAADPASTQSGEVTTSPSDEFSSNKDGGQLTQAAATASLTPSLSAVTDGGFTVAESTSSLTPSAGRASEDAGITAPILASTIQSTETTSAIDESLVTAEVNTTVAPIVESLARDTPFNTDALITPIEVNASASAINTPLVTQFTSQVASITAFTSAISARQLTESSAISSSSTEFAASIDESETTSVSIADILADDAAITRDTGITGMLASSEPSLDEFTREFSAGTRVTQNVQAIESTEQTSAAELAIPETIETFTFTTASDGIAISPSQVALLSVTDIQSTESTRAQELSIPETLSASPILVDAFTQSFEEDDITVEKASTSLATTDSLEESASLSQVNSTTSQVSTLSVQNGFSSATDRGSIITEAEKSIIGSDEDATALDEGSITFSSITTQQSTEFTSSVDEAARTSTTTTPIVSLDEFASTFEEGSRTIHAIQTLTEDAFTSSIEADRLQEFTAVSRDTPSVGIADTDGIQQFVASPLLIDAFTFSTDGTVQSQTITSFEINAITSALEEGTITPSAILTQVDDAFTLSNEFNVEQTVDVTIAQINAQTSAITEGLSVTEATALTFDEFTSAEEEPLVTDVVGTAGTVAENIAFGDTAIARDAAGDEDMSSLSLAEDAETIAYEQPIVTQMSATLRAINAATFAEEEGSITASDAISSDTPSRGISREDNRETNAVYSTFEVTAVTSAIEEGTRTLANGTPLTLDADTSALEEGSLTEKIAESSITASVGVTLEEGVITNTTIDTPTSFESLTPVKDITEITSETGTTSLTTRDPEVTRAFERSRQPDLTATPLVSPDEETSAIVKKAILPVIMEDVVQDEFASAGDTPLVESILSQTFGDGQAVVNQELDELDLTTMAATIPQAGVGINPVVSPTSGLFDTFQSEETFVITSFLAEPRIVAFSKQEDPLDAGAVRAPSIEATEDSVTSVETNDSQTTVEINEYSTELKVRNNGI